jgi:hypothetical protein
MGHYISTRISFLFISIICASVFMAGCMHNSRAYHEYVMRGTIVDKTDKEIYLCIGSKDGARVGQQFDVYKVVKEHFRYQARAITTWTYKRIKTGIVKITEIVDEHFAKAEIVSGTAEKDFLVELEIR